MDSKSESDSQSSTPRKSSKKTKQKSPKLVLQEDDSTGDLIIAEDDTRSSTKSKSSKLVVLNNSNSSSTNKKRKKRDSATSSDEERWLTAIESGKLEEVDDELKKIKPKDPALMTARQRAMYDRSTDGSPSTTTPTLMSLPTGYKEKVMTAEAIQKAAIKSQKRKQLADEKREKDKKKTMDRLLKKQESKATKMTKPKPNRSSIPSVVYQQNIKHTFLSFPKNIDIPLKPQKIESRPVAIYCSICKQNYKKYNCSQTGVPLCSLECYKKNISSRIL